MSRSLEKVIYAELSYRLNGIFFNVHNELGAHCREVQYCDAIEKLLKENDITYKREFYIEYETTLINNSNRVDFLIEDKIIVEVKALRLIGRDEYNQIQRYLQLANFKLGLLLNFHQKYLTPKRILNSKADE